MDRITSMMPSAQLEAVLFAAGEAVSKKRLAALLDASSEEVAAALDALRADLSGRGISLVETDSEVELRTAPEAAPLMKKLREGELSRDLGRAGLEALAVILYRDNGATRTEIDWIRGVNSGAIVRSLLLRGLVERVEDPTDKRKMRYRATTDTLGHLGISKMSDLPRFDELSHETVSAIATAEQEPENHGDA
jgi:segregation and condensation protein B